MEIRNCFRITRETINASLLLGKSFPYRKLTSHRHQTDLKNSAIRIMEFLKKVYKLMTKAISQITTNIKSTDMEVHHHTHTPRKKWTHYFWEFLMLFLAVYSVDFLRRTNGNIILNIRREKTIYQIIC